MVETKTVLEREYQTYVHHISVAFDFVLILHHMYVVSLIYLSILQSSLNFEL